MWQKTEPFALPAELQAREPNYYNTRRVVEQELFEISRIKNAVLNFTPQSRLLYRRFVKPTKSRAK